MSAPVYAHLHTNCRMALRNALAGVQKAQAGPVAGMQLSAAGALTRTDGGSFLANQFSAGDEVALAGFTQPSNNGLCYVTGVTVSTLALRAGGDRALVNESAIGLVTVTTGLPVGQADENGVFSAQPGQPWCRESYKAGPEQRLGTGAPRRVRLAGLYLYTVFYPTKVGTSGLDGMSDAIRQILYPGAQFTYSGQVLTVLAASRQGGMSEAEWVSTVLAVRFRADAAIP